MRPGPARMIVSPGTSVVAPVMSASSCWRSISVMESALMPSSSKPAWYSSWNLRRLRVRVSASLTGTRAALPDHDAGLIEERRTDEGLGAGLFPALDVVRGEDFCDAPAAGDRCGHGLGGHRLRSRKDGEEEAAVNQGPELHRGVSASGNCGQR